jgi:hypothetical protein
MADRLRVTELDFDAIKTNLKTFLQSQSEFTDYDFEGSGLSVLLDILAYNTHYNAYYLNMVANEAFLDTALIRDSVVSHAKTLGYIPSSLSAPRALINFTVESGDTTPATLTVPKGYVFISNLIDNKSYQYVTLNDATVTKSNTQFIFENLEIYEGQLNTYSFNYTENSNPKQIFVLPDVDIDTTTISVTVSPSSSNTQTIVYNRVTDILDVTGTSEVFFLQEGRGGRYEVYFGNNVVGKKLEDGSIVNISYLVTTGAISNKANGFVASIPLNGITNFTIDVVEVASGGSDRETVDNIKFGAAAQFATQNRLVTFKDYESYIKRNYPIAESISVWGGEENIPPVYGKVFVSIKPKSNYFISELEKQRIIDTIITPKAVVSLKTEILDPEFLFILLSNSIRYDSRKTTRNEDQLRTAVRTAVLNYKQLNLDKFDATFVQSKVEKQIDAVEPNAIIGSKSTIRLQKRFLPSLNESKSYTVNFNVPLNRGTISNKLISTEFDVLDTTGVRRTVFFDEIPQSFSGISSIEVTDPGVGYTTEPTVTITGDGIGAIAKAVIVNGKIQRINVENRGIDYTRAIVTITGGNGYGAAASAVIDAQTGTLRTVYYDSNAQRQIVDDNVGSINYQTGTILINDVNILSVSSVDGLIRLTIEAEEGIIESVRNTIITIDETDPISIETTLEKV